MKTKALAFVAGLLLCVSFFVARAADASLKTTVSAPPAAANTTAKSSDAPANPKEEHNKHLAEVIGFYNVLQAQPTTAIPDWVVAKSKGIIIISRWSASVGIGGTGGYGVGWKRVGGTFVGPAFYSVGGGSVGLQLGVSKSTTITFLISDKALLLLTDEKFMWSGNLKAVAGTYEAKDSTGDNTPDIIIYQQTSGVDVGAFVAGIQISVDNDANRKFYDNLTLTPTDIFAGKVKAPESEKAFLASLDKQVKAANK